MKKLLFTLLPIMVILTLSSCTLCDEQCKAKMVEQQKAQQARIAAEKAAYDTCTATPACLAERNKKEELKQKKAEQQRRYNAIKPKSKSSITKKR